MQCPMCGADLAPGDVFCGGCGANVGAVNQQASAIPVAPSAKSGLSTGAIIGIVAGSLVGVLLLGAAGFFAFGVFGPKKPTVNVGATTASKSATQPKLTTQATESPLSSAAEPAPSSDEAVADEVPVVTNAEARDVVKKFIDARIAGDITGSKAFCSKNMLSGETGSFVNDKYWRPDSYKITKTTPDLMFIHVTTMGAWPSGEEPTIYSVWRDPGSGKVLIDGMLDPETVPELVKP
jgi:hypothetical protein